MNDYQMSHLVSDHRRDLEREAAAARLARAASSNPAGTGTDAGTTPRRRSGLRLTIDHLLRRATA